jgi:copper homeostasis protein
MKSRTAFELEVCVDQVAHALAAEAAGATRIEINTALELDGLTPAAASCAWLKAHCGLPIVAMLRPHARDFVYSAAEELSLLRDCQSLLEAGVDGIVFGSLDANQKIALPILRKVMAVCAGREVIFHRAFDQMADQFAALEQLIECGVRRVLTSGGAQTAEAGIDQLQKLMELAAGQIEILPGAGINSSNAHRIATRVGCHQLHGSFRRRGGEHAGPDGEEIRRTRAILEALTAA